MTRHRAVGVRPISLGRNDSRGGILLKDGEAADLLNVDLDRESVAASLGSIKFGNQVAPSSALETRVDRGYARLPVFPEKSAPLRGYGYIPYDERQDIGGILAEATYDLSTTDALVGTRNDGTYPVFNAQRGQSFELTLSFRIPEEEKLYTVTPAKLYDPGAGYAARLGADIALDEFTAIIQKGGDRLQPMSWALGVVNTGDLFDTAVNADGTNIFGFDPSLYSERTSNYALCFIWLDAPKFGEQFPVQMRYRTTDGQVRGNDLPEVGTGDGYGDEAFGEYCTHAYRAFVIPKFVEPGRDYHVALQLKLDTGTAGSGAEPIANWNDNGRIRAIVMDGRTGGRGSELFEYDAANTAAATIYRYKGPGDSLAYFTRYGIRYWGRDPMYIGLGFRYAPWSVAGFIPFGIDSAPLEKGGFRIIDQSIQPPSVYSESSAPAVQGGVGGPSYFLRVARNTGAEATGRFVDVSDKGLVYSVGSYPGVTWGSQANQWLNVSPAGRSPLGGRHSALADSAGAVAGTPWAERWRGLGAEWGDGVTVHGRKYNDEALRGYRLVLAPDSVSSGFSNAGVECAGALLSIKSYSGTGPNGVYAQSVELEGDLSAWTAGPPSFSGNAFRAYVRAFRWNQRPVVVSDLRIYSSPRDYGDARTALSLLRFPDLEDATEPGIGSIVGSWRLDEADGGELVDRVGAVSGFRAPYTIPRATTGSEGTNEVFLSGDGEALQFDFARNPHLKELMSDMLRDGRSGFAVELTCRVPEAAYGLPMQVDATGSRWEARFGSVLASWEVARPGAGGDASGLERAPAPLLRFGQLTSFTGAVAGATLCTDSPFGWPLAFDVAFPEQGDQRGEGSVVPPDVESWVSSGGTVSPRWSRTARWVGQRVTFQFGVEPTDTPEVYRAYLAASPQSSTGPTAGTPGSEWALFDEVTILRRDLERSVVVIGGLWDARRRSYIEANARLIVDAVRVYGATAPGELPAASGGEPERGAGKILGGRSHPQRELDRDDILRPLAGSSSALNLTLGSATAGVAGGAPVLQEGPAASIDAVDRAMLVVDEEGLVLPREERFWARWPRPYFVGSVSSSGLELSSPYYGPSRRAAAAWSFRLLAYTSFSDYGEEGQLRRPLALGRGAGYDVATVDVDDAAVTVDLFESRAPVGVGCSVRVYTPLASARARDIAPRWVRGMKAPGENPILGLHSLNERVFAGVKGALYEVDDRWREDGPSRTLTKSLAFRARRGDSRIPLPLAADRADQVRSDLSLPSLIFPGGGAVRTMLWDAWVKLEEYGTYQTIQWYGSQKEPRAQWWLRLDQGYPELVVSSDDVAVGAGVVPRNGYYVARGDARLPLNRWVHVRWTVTGNTSVGQSLTIPKLAVDGKISRVTVSDKGSSAGAGATDWVHAPTLYPQDGEDLDYFIVGCARSDRLGSGREPVAAQPSNISSQGTEPSSYQGYMDCLGGRIGYLANVQVFTGGPAGVAITDFDPFSTRYDQADTVKVSILREDLQHYGVGHRLLDTASNTYLCICSHPFISLWHEMGRGSKLMSFANYADEVYVANGTRPVVVDSGSAREAGVREPTAKPELEVARQPIWREANFDFGGDPDNDPIIQRSRTAPATAGLNYIYRNLGSLAVTQPAVTGSTLSWDKDEFLTFKCYVKPYRVDGRISLFSKRDSSSNGLFVEIRDGRCVLGWYDLSLKREVFISTNVAVFKPGRWHYVYIRKWFPRGGQASGALIGHGSTSGSNWQNAIFDQTYQSGNQAVAHDMMVVRAVPVADNGEIYSNFTGYDLKAWRAYSGGGTWAAAGSSSRACVSFTVDDADWTSLGVGHTVTLTGLVASYATSSCLGTNITISGAGNEAFVLDHEGMLCQFSQGNLAGQVYRIVSVISATQIRVVNASSASPGFTAPDSAGRLVIATGVSLVKSDGFEDSTSPDNSTYAVEIFGDSASGDPLSGLQPFYGEFISFAMVSALGENYGGVGVGNYGSPDIFEDSGAKFTAGTIVSGNEIGTDNFGDNATNYSGGAITGLPFEGCPLQRLEVDETDRSYACADIRAYGINDGAQTTWPPNSNRGTGSALPGFPTTGAQSTSSEDFVFNRLRSVVGGTRRIVVSFYDPENDTESYPNSDGTGQIEPLILSLGAEEPNNPSGSIGLVVRSWPKPVEDREIWLRVYVSPIDSLEFFRVAEVDAASSDSLAFELDDTLLAAGTPLTLLVGAPPSCEVVSVAQNSMIYGGLLGDQDLLMHSLPGLPESVPPSYINGLNTGAGQGVTGLAELGGFLIACKRNGIFAGTISNSFISWIQVTLSDGCVSHASVAQLEDRVYMVSARGPLVLLPGQQRPVPFYLGKRVEGYFREDVDQGSLDTIAGVLYWRRNQYLFTVRSRGRLLTDTRIGLEFDHPYAGPQQLNEMVAGHRFTVYEGPAVTRLATVRPRAGGSSLLIGGTSDGFVIWMDRDDTRLHMMGPDGPVAAGNAWGDKLLVHAGLGEVTGDVDLIQEGPRGAVLRWLDGELEREGYIILAYEEGGSTYLLVRGESESEPPDADVGATLTVGAQLHLYETKEYDEAAPHIDKEALMLDVSRRTTSGSMLIDCYRNMEAEPKGTETMDLSESFEALNVGRHLKQARTFRFKIKTKTPAVDTDFELYDLVLRIQDSDNR